MEIILLSILTTLLAFVFLKRTTTTTTKLNQPPSPWRLPVIGNLHQVSLYPHRSLHSLSLRYGPLMLLHFGRVPVLVVSSAEVAHDVMKTHDLKFANRPQTKATLDLLKGGREIAFSSYGEYWKQIKGLCVVHLLSNKMVKSSESLREEEIKLMMSKLENASSSSSSVDMSEILFNLVNNVVCRISLGKKYIQEDNIKNVKTTMRAFVQILGEFPVGDYIPYLSWVDRIRGLDKRLEEARKAFDEFLENILQDHEGKGETKDEFDFVDILLQLQREKKNGVEIDRGDIRLIILDILIAGTQTTSTLMEWAMTELIRHPETMKKLREDIRKHSRCNLYMSEEEVDNMKYLKAVIKEVLRIHPPGPILVPRQLNEDVKLKGYDIAAGTQVIINAWSIQRDTETWGSDAEEFKPERHLYTSLDFQGQNFMYIPFGSGRRLCPGLGLALALAHVTLANLVSRFQWRVEARPLGDDDDYNLAETTGIEVSRKFPLVAFPTSL